jgi:hypothetical protein
MVLEARPHTGYEIPYFISSGSLTTAMSHVNAEV